MDRSRSIIQEVRMSVREFTFDDVKNILVNRVGLPEDAVRDDPNLSFEDMGLDSLAFVEIQLAIQQEYGFTIPDEDAEKLTTVGQGIEYVNQRLSEQNGGE
jgi:acyl carrier protein